jgi:hypothetical protein
MRVRSAVVLLFCWASLVVAQDQGKENLCRNGSQPANAAEQDALDWAATLGKRFSELHDPVVAAYSLGTLGGIVCRVDRAAGADIYRESLERLKLLTPVAFTSHSVTYPFRVSPLSGNPSPLPR